MEKQMRNRLSAVVGCIIIAMLLVVGGCSEKTSTGGGGNNTTDNTIRSLQVLMGDDTLESLPGDSASTNVVVIGLDANGLVVANQRVIVTLQNPLLGLLEYADPARRDTTNDQGQVLLTYRTFGQYGANAIMAQSGNVAASHPFLVREATNVVGNLYLTVTPPRMIVGEGSIDSATVYLVISTIDGHGIANINPNLRVIGGGHLGQIGATDDNGALVVYYFPDNFVGDAIISASVGGRTAQDSCHVEFSSQNGILTLTTDARRIKADGCVTPATLTANLRDQFGTAIVGDTIFFGTPGRGFATSWGITDSLGRVTGYLCGGGIPNEADPADSAMVIARYPQWGLYDTVNVRIDPAANVESVSLNSTGTTVIAGTDSIGLTVTCLYDDGTRVSGLYAVFYADCGLFSADSVRLVNGALNARQYWKDCITVSPPGERYEVYCAVDGVPSNVIQMTVNPGDARRLDIEATQPIVPARSNVECLIAVADTFGNLVRDGVAVICSTSAGQLSSRIVATDVNGIARVTLATGTQAGSVTVKAQLGGSGAADSTVIQVLPGNAASVQLEINPPSVQAAGTGGQSSAQLRALVRDANNNPAPDGTVVRFAITGGPGGGININNVGTSDSAQTTNGLAVVTLNAGTNLGPFTIEACAVVEPEPVCARSSAGSVVAGPPANIVIFPNEVGTDAGGGAWDLEIAALVLDALNNAVRCSVAVFFEVAPDTAQILSAEVFTCNPDADNTRRPGTAYTTLRYLSPATNQQVAITARTAPPGAATATILFQLPIQEPSIDLICTPNSWNFTERQVDPSQIWCTAYVQDGHSTFINGATVVFTTQRGQLFTAATGGSVITDGRRVSGPPPVGSSPQNTDGMCFVWLRGREEFVFPGPVSEVTCEVRAEVQGYGEATDAVVVNFQR